MTVYFVGTSHIAQESIEKINKTIKKVKPTCVAVEIDLDRYVALKNQKKGKVEGPFFQKTIFILLQSLQEKLAKETGIFAGKEMLEAVELAKKNRSKVAFIDQPINITFSRMMKRMSFFEKTKLIAYLLLGVVGLPFIGMKKIDLRKIPSERFIEEATSELRKKFPTIYQVLVLERDAYMASCLKYLSKKYKKIVAVVGAGHVKGIKKNLRG